MNTSFSHDGWQRIVPWTHVCQNNIDDQYNFLIKRKMFNVFLENREIVLGGRKDVILKTQSDHYDKNCAKYVNKSDKPLSWLYKQSMGDTVSVARFLSQYFLQNTKKNSCLFLLSELLKIKMTKRFNKIFQIIFSSPLMWSTFSQFLGKFPSI